MKNNYLLLGIFLLAAVGVAVVIVSNGNSQKFSKEKYLAVVGGDTGISREKVQTSLSQKLTFFTYTKQTLPSQKILEKEIVNNLTNFAYIQHYAKTNKVNVSLEELQTRFQKVLLSTKMNERDFLSKINLMYSESKEQYFEILYQDILTEKVKNSINEPLSTWLEKQKKSEKIEYL